VSRLHGGYRLGTSDGMAYGIETQGGSMCALGPDAPSAVLWGWCEMFEVERGAIGLIGVMGLYPSPAFGAPNHFPTVPERLLDGDLRLTCSLLTTQ
jgi:hypothetical protein